ncbi:MAG TPA: hypothetical protein VF765_35785 [Polyangiaceae bacterium]
MPLLGALVTGCSSPGGAGEGAPDASLDEGGGFCLTCASDVSIDAPPLVRVKGEIDQVCSNADGCHGSGAGNMGLTPGNEFTAMINVASSEMPTLKRVVPGDPEHSYVYLKVACEGGIDGACMPLSSGFDPRIKQMFHDWIEAGAPTQ